LLRRRILRRKTGGFVGAYDVFAASLAHVYEPARRALTSYTGALCRLRRASDDAELDWGYLANGDLDVVSIAAWAGGASYVVSVYDQVAGDTITQAVKVNQPLFVASAQNSHAGMTLDGVNDYLQGAFTTGGELSQPTTYYAIVKSIAPTEHRYIFGDGDGETIRYNGTRTNVYFGASIAASEVDANTKLIGATVNGATSTVRTNGVSVAGDAGAYNPNGLTLGARSDGADNFWKGNILSFLIFDPSLSLANQVILESALNTYWAVY